MTYPDQLSTFTFPIPRPIHDPSRPSSTVTPMSTFLGTFPPTPAPSSYSSADSDDPDAINNKMMSERYSPSRVYDQSLDNPAGPSYQQEAHYFPPTPPSLSDSPTRSDSSASMIPNQLPNELHFAEQLRNRRARRPVSVVSTVNTSDRPPFLPPRKYTDPTPQSRPFLDDTEELSPNPHHQLDVDLEAYSTTDYDEESRAPTLSFVTTSTTESTASTPPPGIYGGFKPDLDGKGHEPRIRMRTTTGRANAYSSAESSMGSGAYSYHSYSDNHVYHPHPPPLPAIPIAFAQEADRVGLGIGSVPSRISPTATSSTSPISYQHRPWHRDVSKHIRNESASTSTSTTSGSNDEDPSPGSLGYHFNGYNLSEHIPWGGEAPKEARALLSVEEGRERIFDAARLSVMGGVEALTDEDMRGLAGVTHLLLPKVGSSILQILPSLIAVLAPSLLVADLSDNDLTFLPESLRNSTSLEELNISNNPLRVLPIWLSDLASLHVLVVDGCGLATMPGEMSHLAHLHTVCARRNKLVSLPAWLCLLTHLETLRVDDNPFAPEWKPIVNPILAGPSRIARPPFMPRDTASSDQPIPSLDSSSSSINVLASPISPSNHDQTHPTLRSIAEHGPQSAPLRPDSEYSTPITNGNRLRKMRSAGTLLVRSMNLGSSDDQLLSPTSIPHSAASTPGLSASSSSTLLPPSAGRFDGFGSAVGRRTSSAAVMDDASVGLTASSSKSGKWGSLMKKMSRTRLRGDKAALTISASSNVKLMPPPLRHNDSEPLVRPSPTRPSINTAHSAVTLPTLPIQDEDVSEFGVSASGPKIKSDTLPLSGGLPAPSSLFWGHGTAKRGKRRSFLPIDPTPPSINVTIPSASPFMPSTEDLVETLPTLYSETTIADETLTASSSLIDALQAETEADADAEARYAQGLESIKSYLRDLYDLSRPVVEPYGGFEVVNPIDASTMSSSASNTSTPASGVARSSISDRRRQQSILERSRCGSVSVDDGHGAGEADFAPSEAGTTESGKRFKNDPVKRARVLREIYDTERTYVRSLGELVNIYVKPSALPVRSGNAESVIPAGERKIVFGGIESILTIHRDNLLPALEKAVKPLFDSVDDDAGDFSAETAHAVGETFRTYIAYMKQYSTYINNFDNALTRMKSWTSSATPHTPTFGKSASPTISSIAGLAASGAAGSVGMQPTTSDPGAGHMNAAQRKRVKHFIKRSRESPLHSQINLESYLLLPIQRVPRYKMLLEDLAMCTPPSTDAPRDSIDDSLSEISGLAQLMNEEKRDAESRLRLYFWQKRISSRGPSPLVQPHRKLLLDGGLNLLRLVKKAQSFVEIDSTALGDGDSTIMPTKTIAPVEYILPEPMDRQMILILCTDLMVLVQPRAGEGGGKDGMVDLYNVLRMSTVREPASIVYGDVLRVVDNKSIYYFSGSTPAQVLEWCRAINSARRR